VIIIIDHLITIADLLIIDIGYPGIVNQRIMETGFPETDDPLKIERTVNTLTIVNKTGWLTIINKTG
jgi:hypothetical protein